MRKAMICRNLVLVSALIAFCATSMGAEAGKKQDWKTPADWPMPERWLPVDEQGWTIVEPAADSRLIYVSSSEGNDETAVFYAPGDAEIGKDPLQPSGGIKAYKTVDRALEQARDGQPDWILLKRGDTWWDSLITLRNGRSKTEPAVVRAYGQGPRPVLRGSKGGVQIGAYSYGAKNTVIMDMHVYASSRDPKKPDLEEDQRTEAEKKSSAKLNHMGFRHNGGARSPGQYILVENCRLRYVNFNASNARPAKYLVIRRNLLLDLYPSHGHGVGFWSANGSFLLEENVFDHGGWLYQNTPENKGKPGLAIPLSHNFYVATIHHSIIRNNIFSRSASMGNKFTSYLQAGYSYDIVVDNNLYLDGEIGISLGGNHFGQYRYKNLRVLNNVMLDIGRSRPTNRRLAWYFDVTDCDGALVANNLFLHQPRKAISNVFAIRCKTIPPPNEWMLNKYPHLKDLPITPSNSRNVTIRDNIIHGLDGSTHLVILEDLDRLENYRFENNQVQSPGFSSGLVSVSGDKLGSFTFKGNHYYSVLDEGKWFEVNGKFMGFDKWGELTGETDARAGKIEYPDDTRCIETYMKHLGKKADIDAFITEIRSQSKNNWRTDFTAEAVNDWVREGFGAKKEALNEY